MRYRDHIDAIESAADGFAALLDMDGGDLVIRSCPGWTLDDLARHLAEVHAWALGHIVGETSTRAAEPTRAGAELQASFRSGAMELVAQLGSRDARQRCWTLYEPAVVGTWARRLALETTLHLWDASDSAGAPVAISSDLAAAGASEVIHDMQPRQVALGRMPELESGIELVLQDFEGGAHAPLRLGSLGAPAAGELRMRAEDAFLLLWKRRTLDQIVVEHSGDLMAMQAVLEAPLTP